MDNEYLPDMRDAHREKYFRKIKSRRVVLIFKGISALFIFSAFLFAVPSANSHSHSKSKIRYRDYTRLAFEDASREKKPILMVMSAVRCSWCAKYNRGALRDSNVVEYLNKNFISVFVDIDRRVDLKRKYVRGVPTTVVFSPKGKVIRSFSGVLKSEDLLWFLKKVRKEALRGVPAPEKAMTTSAVSTEIVRRKELVREVDEYLDKFFDKRYGGFGKGEKYPQGWVLAYLMDRYDRDRKKQHLEIVLKTIEGMLGGLYDPVDGGFFRYATRRNWGAPRTEKISAVNGALLPALYRASSASGSQRFRQAAGRTADFMIKRLYDRKAGGFFGSQSARGKYYKLNASGRKNISPPPLNRTKYTAWNAQVILGLIEADRFLRSSRWKGEVLRSVDFMRRDLLTADGVKNEGGRWKGGTPLLGQLESNAWAAFAFVEAYIAYGRAEDRMAARQTIEYSIRRLFDQRSGIFIEWRNPHPELLRRGEDVSSEAPIDLNGVMALALLRLGRHEGDGRYIGIAKRVLMNFVGKARKDLRAGDAWDDNGKILARVVFVLRAYDLFLERA